MSRRPRTGSLRRGGFREPGNGGGALTALGVQFTSTAQYAVGVAGNYANAYRRMRMIWSPDAQPGTGLGIAAGIDNGGGGSILIGAQDTSAGTYANGQILAFDGVYSTRASIHVMTTAELGRYIVDDVWTDGTSIWHARNGRLIGVQIADVNTSWSSGFAFSINSRPGTPGTLGFGAMTVFDIQLSTSVPTGATAALRLATVRADAQRLPGVAISDGRLNHWHTGAGLTSSTWTDQVSSRVLTFTGSPLTTSKLVLRKGAGQLHFQGDSNIIQTNGGTVVGNGPRKYVLDDVLAAGYAATVDGKFAVVAGTTKNFDGRNTGVGGQAIGVLNGAVVQAQTTIAADLAAYVAPDGSLVLNWGANDGYVYCNTPGGNSGVAGAALYFAAYDALMAVIGPYMNTGRPIVITTPRRPATGVSTAAQRDFFVEVQAGWAAKIATYQASYTGVELADSYSLITNTQADADDVARQPDGIHLADAWIPVEAGAQSAALLRALARAPT